MQFLLVYVKEAHAIDSRSPSWAGPIVEDPVSDIERLEGAGTCGAKLDLDMIPAVIDRRQKRGGGDQAPARPPPPTHARERALSHQHARLTR